MRSFPPAARGLAVTLLLAATLPAQDYRSSVVGTDWDYIHSDDPSAELCLEFKFQGFREMPDKRGNRPLFKRAFVFVAYFKDGTSVDIAIDVAFRTEAAALVEAQRYVPRLGKLPTSLRKGVERLVVHAGGRDTTAFSDRGLIVVYADNATKRISTNDLEETIFHESVHASWDREHADSKGWRAAQKSDGRFVTHYARKNPDGEDLAETALFAYALLHHPGRIPAADASKIKAAVPARIAYVKALLPPGKPIFHQVGPRYACDGSGKTFVVPTPRCRVNITSAGGISDILSNALMRGLKQPEKRVRNFFDTRLDEFDSRDALLKAASAEFGFDRETLVAKVNEYLHCNCSHGDEYRKSPNATWGKPSGCIVDETSVGFMADILSNALLRGFDREEADVKAFLKRAHRRFNSPDELLAAAVKRFKLDRKKLDAQVKKYLHANCKH